MRFLEDPGADDRADDDGGGHPRAEDSRQLRRRRFHKGHLGHWRALLMNFSWGSWFGFRICQITAPSSTIALRGMTTMPSRMTKLGPSPFLILSRLHKRTLAPTRASLSRMAFSMTELSPMPTLGRPRRWFSVFSWALS